jgi:hypothetical protein
MKLITHNLLVCNKKTCMNQGVKNFPLQLKVDKWIDYDDESTLECSKPLMSNLAMKLDWDALRQTVASVSKTKSPFFYPILV